MRLLEAQLGVTLFERVPKGLAFTALGCSYHAQVAEAFEELRAAPRTLRPEPGKVLVSVTPTFAAKWLIPNLPEFSRAHPDIDLRVLATERVSSFRSDGVDPAVRQGQPPFGAALDAIRLFRQEIIAVAAPSLSLGQRLPLYSEALAQLPKLHDAHDLWPGFLRALRIEDRSGRGMRLSQTSLAIDAALSGQGIALVSRFLVTRDLAAGTLVQVITETFDGKQDFICWRNGGPIAIRQPKPCCDGFHQRQSRSNRDPPKLPSRGAHRAARQEFHLTGRSRPQLVDNRRREPPTHTRRRQCADSPPELCRSPAEPCFSPHSPSEPRPEPVSNCTRPLLSPRSLAWLSA